MLTRWRQYCGAPLRRVRRTLCRRACQALFAFCKCAHLPALRDPQHNRQHTPAAQHGARQGMGGAAERGGPRLPVLEPLPRTETCIHTEAAGDGRRGAATSRRARAQWPAPSRSRRSWPVSPPAPGARLLPPAGPAVAGGARLRVPPVPAPPLRVTCVALGRPRQARRLEGELESKLQALTKLCAGFEASYHRSRQDAPGLGHDQVRRPRPRPFSPVRRRAHTLRPARPPACSHQQGRPLPEHSLCIFTGCAALAATRGRTTRTLPRRTAMLSAAAGASHVHATP
jgi:hypothetical protein